MADESDELSGEQVEEIHHHAAGHTGWVKYAALTAAMLATLAAISGAMASLRLTESSRAQIQSNNQWSYYQSKSIKHHLAEMEAHLLAASPSTKPATVDSETKIAQYEKQMEEIKTKAEEREAASEENLHIHEVLERGATFFHIAIAVIAICLLTKRRAFFALSALLGGAGVFFFIQGLLLHVR